MLRLILIFIFSLLLGKALHIFFSEKYAGKKKAEYVVFYIKQEQGAIGCYSKEKYQQLVEAYKQNNINQINSYLQRKECFLYKKNYQLSALDNICESGDPNEMAEFSVPHLLLKKIYLACFAIARKT
jgi:hypothetical protein